jgi:hypothetical protein
MNLVRMRAPTLLEGDAVSAYSVALFFHLVSFLVAAVAATLAGFAAWRLRGAGSAREAAEWGMLIDRVVHAFPVATLGLVGSGAYMTEDVWSWSTPWIVASIVGLGLIVVLGAGIEGRRGEALKRELMRAGMSERARRLLRDPLSWSAKVTTWTLLIAVVFAMATKPSTGGAIASIAGALAGGIVLAIPFWRSPAAEMAVVGIDA